MGARMDDDSLCMKFDIAHRAAAMQLRSNLTVEIAGNPINLNHQHKRGPTQSLLSSRQ